MGKRKLYLITETFPWGQGEKSFLRPELPGLAERFDVTVISRAQAGARADEASFTPLPETVRLLHYPGVPLPLGQKLLGTLAAFVSPLWWREVADILRAGDALAARLLRSLGELVNARAFARWLKREEILSREAGTVCYAYWYTWGAMAVALLRGEYPQLRLVVRAHGWDFLEDARRGARGFKWYMDSRVDRVIFACRYGLEYYRQRYAQSGAPGKYVLSRLGQYPPALSPAEPDGELALVSCAHVIPLKRVELIVCALSLLDDIPIRWTHFGGGAGLEELRHAAENMLGGRENIRYSLRGAAPNETVLRFYAENHVDAIVHLSRSEGGCPVALQEAMARGIPAVAASVGGVTEMLEGCGYLLPADPAPEEVAAALRALYSSSPAERGARRAAARARWEELFNMENNLPRLLALLEGGENE